jgi:hypothetical protein
MPRSAVYLRFAYDNLLLLKDAGALTATGVGQVGGQPKILDLGQNAFNSGVLVLNVSAIDATTGDESYRIDWQGSTSPTFASGIVILASRLLGGTTATGMSAATAPDIYYVPFAAELGGTSYRYARLNVVIGGTTPSINFTAFLSPAGYF